MLAAFLFIVLSISFCHGDDACCPTDASDPNCVCSCFNKYCSVQCDDAKSGSNSTQLPHLQKLSGECTVDLTLNNYYQVTQIPAGAFDVGCNITSLSLQNNGFVDADLKAFKDSKDTGIAVDRLILYGNHFKEIPKALLVLSDLTHLTFQGNIIGPNLKSDSFVGLSKVESLILSMGTGLEVVEGNAFSGLPSLKFLSLDDNILLELKTDSFAGLTNVQNFGFDGLKFQLGAAIRSRALSGLANLQNLVISINGMSNGTVISNQVSNCFTEINIECDQLVSLSKIQVIDGICTDLLALIEKCSSNQVMVSIPRISLSTNDQKALWLDLTNSPAKSLSVYMNPFLNQSWASTPLILGLNGSAVAKSLEYRYPHPPCDHSYSTFTNLTQISLSFSDWPYVPFQLSKLPQLGKLSIFYPLVCNCSNFWLRNDPLLDKMEYPPGNCKDGKQKFRSWVDGEGSHFSCGRHDTEPPVYMSSKCFDEVSSTHKPSTIATSTTGPFVGTSTPKPTPIPTTSESNVIRAALPTVWLLVICATARF